jgi:hypothetical protein
MKRVGIIIVALVMAGFVQAQSRIVSVATTNRVIHMGSPITDTNHVGYIAGWTTEDKAPARVREFSLVYASAVTGTVSVAVVKNGVTIPRYTASLSNETSFVWEPSFLKLYKGDRVVVTGTENVSNSVVIDME